MYPEIKILLLDYYHCHTVVLVLRVFSAVNINKTKLRNRLSTETLCGLLLSKQLIKECDDKTCYYYDVTKKTIDKH